VVDDNLREWSGRLGALTVGVLMLVAQGPAVAAQEPMPGQKSICFRGAPARECRAFAITEVAVGYWIAPAPPSDPYRSLTDNLAFTGDFGAMVNVGDRVAVGGLLGPGWTGTLYLSVKPRVRFWLSEHAALDASPGVTVLNRGLDAPRVGLDLSFMVRDRFGVTAQAMEIEQDTCVGEVWPPTCVTTHDWRLYLGVRAGSDLGTYGAGLGVLGGAVGLLVLTLLFASGASS